MSSFEASGIHHAFEENDVVRGVDFSVDVGEVACLLGPSGCGKTTLLRLGAGLERVQAGQIKIGGVTVADGATFHHVAPERRSVGMMFQDYALFPHLTVFENIAFGLQGKPSGRLEWIGGALDRMGLTGYAEAYPHTLSGGQQQRAALLRALAPEPEVLLLDEPFSGLDVTLRAQVREETLELLKETGVSTLLVTHDPEEAMYMADKILVMDEGRILQADPPAKTYSDPVNDYVAGLFGPVNRLVGKVEFGQVQTPLGPFNAPGLKDGESVQVYIRPEGVDVAPADDDSTQDGFAMTVAAVRLLGRSSHVRMRQELDKGREINLQARIPGIFRGREGDRVSVRVQRDHAFVFPKI